MKLSLIENGIDSLQKGYNFLTIYEESLFKKKDEKERSYILKDAIVYIHHGIEILMKHILSMNSEYLLFSNINKDAKQAFFEKNQKKLLSVFETSKKMKIHTVTYEEAYERLKFICGYNFSEKFELSIKKLDDYRNLLTHSEFHINEEDIISLFDNFIIDVDNFFFKSIGDDYKTMSGYSTLIRNSEKYINALKESGLELKSNFLTSMLSIFEELKFGIGDEEVIRITDIDLAIKIFNRLYENNFKFGTDLYNMICSGDVTKIQRVDKTHLSMFMKDNDLEVIFKFRSLIFYLPQIDSSYSPIFFFECDKDEDVIKKNNKILTKDYFGKNYIEGIYFYEGDRKTIDPIEIEEFYSRCEYDEEFVLPAYHRIYQYTDKGMFAFLNIQGLTYGDIASIIKDARDIDGKDFLIQFKTAVSK